MSRAQQIAAKLLEYDFEDGYRQRAGGPDDPLRQVGMPMNTDKFNYTGTRSAPPHLQQIMTDIDQDPSLSDEEKAERKNEVIHSAREAGKNPMPKNYGPHANRMNLKFGESLNEVKRVIKRPVETYESVCPHCNEVIREKSTYSESFDAPMRHGPCGGAIEFAPVDPSTIAPEWREFFRKR